MSGRRNLMMVAGKARSSDALGWFRAGLRLRTEQLHQLVGRGLRLLPQLCGEPRRQLEIELGIPIVRQRLDGSPEFFLGAAEPSEPRLVAFFGACLVEERRARPEMRTGSLRRALRLVDGLVEPLEAVQQPELVRDDAVVLGWKRLFGRRDAIEARFGRS